MQGRSRRSKTSVLLVQDVNGNWENYCWVWQMKTKFAGNARGRKADRKGNKANGRRKRNETDAFYGSALIPCGCRVWSFAIQKDSRLRRIESCFLWMVSMPMRETSLMEWLAELKCSTIGSFFLWSLMSDLVEVNRV